MTKYVVMAGWEDTPHITREDAAKLTASYLPYERDARTKGIPSIGAGKIYPVAEEDIVYEDSAKSRFVLEPWFEYGYAMDVGWRRTACLWFARNPETDIVYVWSEYYQGQQEPVVHAEAIRSRGPWIKGVIDPAAHGAGQKDGEKLLTLYRDLGLDVMPADNSVTAGIYTVWARFTSGRLKVHKSLANFWTEYRVYRRDEQGNIVKENDHLMDCLRYICMTGVNVAIQKPVSLVVRAGGRHEVEYNPFEQEWRPQ